MRATLSILAIALAIGTVSQHTALAQERFHRGDVTADGEYNLTDPVFLLGHLFTGGPRPPCAKAADVNDSGTLDISDAIYLLNYLFVGSEAPPPPFLECGTDPTPDDLDCEDYPDLPTCVEPTDEFAELVASYGIIETIAGSGRFRENGNYWDDDFEGGPATEAELSRPHNCMGDVAGNYYIADKESHAIRKVSPEGIITTWAGINVAGNGGDDPAPATETALNSPNGLWVRAADGAVFILDMLNGKIRKVTPDGTISTLFVVEDGIPVGRGLWVSDAEDLAYVAAGNRVLRWTPDEGVEAFSTGYASLGNLTVDPDGFLVVTDRFAHRVYRVDEAGVPSPIAGNGTSSRGVSGFPATEIGLEEVRGVFFRPDGSFFLGTHESSQVWFVDTQGIAHLFVDGAEGAHGGDGERFDTPGFKISEVRNVTVDPAGNVIITEHDAGNIRRVRRVEAE